MRKEAVYEYEETFDNLNTKNVEVFEREIWHRIPFITDMTT